MNTAFIVFVHVHSVNLHSLGGSISSPYNVYLTIKVNDFCQATLFQYVYSTFFIDCKQEEFLKQKGKLKGKDGKRKKDKYSRTPGKLGRANNPSRLCTIAMYIRLSKIYYKQVTQSILTLREIEKKTKLKPYMKLHIAISSFYY